MRNAERPNGNKRQIVSVCMRVSRTGAGRRRIDQVPNEEAAYKANDSRQGDRGRRLTKRNLCENSISGLNTRPLKLNTHTTHEHDSLQTLTKDGDKRQYKQNPSAVPSSAAVGAYLTLQHTVSLATKIFTPERIDIPRMRP